MNITLAKYYQNPITGQNEIIKIVVNGITMDVPINSNNSDYAEIMRQVESGDLTIADADPIEE